MNNVYNRRLSIVAQDPGLRRNGRILTTQVDVPVERLDPGPRGYRAHVIDYDSTARTLFKPLPTFSDRDNPHSTYQDRYESATNATILNDPRFHAQNVYAIVMRVLARFEFALGRRVSWGFGGHQIKVAPHAFADANAFYSRRDEGLFFGYFVSPRTQHTIFSCLSHDVIAHETTHALLDGLRSRYLDPSSYDQAAFHEGFADVVALLSVFSLRDVVRVLIDFDRSSKAKDAGMIARSDLKKDVLGRSVLFKLAEEMGSELSAVRGSALRESYGLAPNRKYLKSDEFTEPHRRGEILVAAMLRTFIDALSDRLATIGDVKPGYLDRNRVVEEAADLADYLLTMSIRAIDYCPAVHLTFSDFLSAALTADRDIHVDDNRFRCRAHLKSTFAAYGIESASKQPEGYWESPEANLNYQQTRFESMQRDPDEVFRFVWENRSKLGIEANVFSKVESVRPCVRIGPDGFYLRETVAEYVQIIDLKASELKTYKIGKPRDMPSDTPVRLCGGGILLFDEYGLLKYHVRNRLLNSELQTERIGHLWNAGVFGKGATRRRKFANLHRMKAVGKRNYPNERWLNDAKDDIEIETDNHMH